MRTASVIVMFLFLAACGRKEAGESGPAPAPEEKAQEEKLSEMAADRPATVGPPSTVPSTGPSIGPPSTGEVKSEDPANTRDATPTEPAAVPVPGDKTEPGPATPRDEVKTVAPQPGVSSMATGTKSGGGPGGGEDLDDLLRNKTKKSPKPVTKATGFHDKEQDEPTQE